MKSDSNWWKAFKLLFKKKEQFCSPLIQMERYCKNKKKAHIFYFISQSTVDDSSADPLGEPPAAKHKISNKMIKPPEVYKLLKNLNTNKTTGPDGLSNKILKEAAPVFTGPLCKLLNMCLAAGQFQDVCKEPLVILPPQTTRENALY